MRNTESNHSPKGRGRFNESNEGDVFAQRSGERRRHEEHHGHGRGDARGRGPSMRGGRGRRGDVRIAVLALLNERPMHGYEMMQELADRSRGLWRPSPGSLYPALQLLEDQGLVVSASDHGRRQFSLSEEGRSELAARPTGVAPWESVVRQADQGDVALDAALRHVHVAVSQVAEAGTAEQKVKAETLLTELRRQMYLLLAESLAPTES